MEKLQESGNRTDLAIHLVEPVERQLAVLEFVQYVLAEGGHLAQRVLRGPDAALDHFADAQHTARHERHVLAQHNLEEGARDPLRVLHDERLVRDQAERVHRAAGHVPVFTKTPFQVSDYKVHLIDRRLLIETIVYSPKNGFCRFNFKGTF